jgi:hypothetical protein
MCGKVHLGFPRQVGGDMIRVPVLRHLGVRCAKRAMVLDIAGHAGQNGMIHLQRIVGDARMQRQVMGVRHRLSVGLAQQSRMGFQEPALMVAQIGHGVDLPINRLPLRRIKFGFWKPDLPALRMLAL